jgi:hypothetical protein
LSCSFNPNGVFQVTLELSNVDSYLQKKSYITEILCLIVSENLDGRAIPKIPSGPRPYILECPSSPLGFTHYKMNVSISRSKGIDRVLFIRRRKIPPTFKE